MKSTAVVLTLALLVAAAGAWAQLPPDSVKLHRVKIPEKQKSHELDPVTLEPADPGLPTWEYNGVTYGSSKPDSKDKFMANPDAYIERAAKQRWENNFIQAMSRVWCPVTDEVTSGGGLIWNELGIQWESCCQFCNDTKTEEDFPRALERLKKRAAEAYELTHGKYVEGASSPVEGAVDFGEGFPDEKPAEGVQVASLPELEPAWLKGQTLTATWNGGVGLIFDNRCLECHRPGGPAPMEFTTHGKVRQWTKKMKELLETRLMPPWPAGASGQFANSKRLTQKELDVLLEWVAAGFPKGEGAEYAISDHWMGEWLIGQPDHVFDLGSHTLAEDKGEHVAEYEIETNFDSDKHVVAAEVHPSDTFLILQIDAGPLGAYHPGNTVTTLPEGSAFLLKKGEKVKVRVFYTKEKGWEETDASTQFAVKFAPDPSKIRTLVAKDRMGNDTFTIPAGKDAFEAVSEFTFPSDGRIVSLTPVMRFRGKKLAVEAAFPDGKKQDLFSIGYWDPAWHFTYQMLEPIPAPKGTVVRLVAQYDNSEANAKNPDPKTDVKAGPGGELLEGWIAYSLR